VPNYNDQNPIVSFRLKEWQKRKFETLAKKDAKYKQATDLIKEVLIKYLNEELVESTKEIKFTMEELKVEKLKEEIRYLKIKNDFAENFDKPLSNSASRIIKPAITTNNEIINGVSPYDANNKRLQCTDCGVLLTWNSFDTYLQQIKEYKNHILSRHNRELSAIEKDVINNLKYEGKSK
jgi:hypothetical protein